MPTEAPEHAGPIVIWRKELRPGAGADGAFRSGLSQVLEIAPPMATNSPRCSTAPDTHQDAATAEMTALWG